MAGWIIECANPDRGRKTVHPDRATAESRLRVIESMDGCRYPHSIVPV